MVDPLLLQLIMMAKYPFDLNTATKNQITTNTTDIAANKGKIATNTTNIAANTTALARNISLVQILALRPANP